MGRTEFTDDRLADHIDGFQSKPAPTFGAAGLEQRIADLEKRVAELEARLKAKVVAKG